MPQPAASGTVTLTAALGGALRSRQGLDPGMSAPTPGDNDGRPSRVFNIAAGVEVSISDVTISNAKNQFTGGAGIRNNGNLPSAAVRSGQQARRCRWCGRLQRGHDQGLQLTFIGTSRGRRRRRLFNSGTALIVNRPTSGTERIRARGLQHERQSMLISNCTIRRQHRHHQRRRRFGPIDDRLHRPAPVQQTRSSPQHLPLQNGGQVPTSTACSTSPAATTSSASLASPRAGPWRRTIMAASNTPRRHQREARPARLLRRHDPDDAASRGQPALDKGNNALSFRRRTSVAIPH